MLLYNIMHCIFVFILFFRYFSILYVIFGEGIFYIDLSDIKWGWKFYGCLALIKIYRILKYATVMDIEMFEMLY